MIKNFTALELKSGDRVYKLSCECDSPLGELHDVLCQMKAHVVKLINDAYQAELLAKPSEEEPPKEE